MCSACLKAEFFKAGGASQLHWQNSAQAPSGQNPSYGHGNLQGAPAKIRRNLQAIKPFRSTAPEICDSLESHYSTHLSAAEFLVILMQALYMVLLLASGWGISRGRDL